MPRLPPLADALLNGAAVFAVLQLLLSAMGWFSQDGGDVLLRRRLDQYWATLHAQEWVVLVRDMFVRFSRLADRIAGALRLRWQAFAVALSTVHLLVAALLSNLVVPSNPSEVAFAPYASWSTFLADYWLEIVVMVALVWLCGPLDLLSTFLTVELIRRTAAMWHLRYLLLLAAMLSCAAVVSLSWLVFCELISVINRRFPETGATNPAVALVFALPCAIPAALYIAIALVHLLAAATPVVLQKALTKLIYLVTTDKEPVLGRLGTVLGGVGGTLTAIATLVT